LGYYLNNLTLIKLETNVNKIFGKLAGAVSVFLMTLFLASPALAAEGMGIDGSSLNLWWVLPFVGILLSIAIFPLAAPDFWHHHFGKISAFWAVMILVPMLLFQGFSVTLYEVLHVYLLEYFPFIILLLALFTISGGVRLVGTLSGSPLVNTGILLVGTILASWMGTTGAAMLLIRPLINANSWRQKKVHTIVFFIFLVANIGGSLSPLGDPPLFLGFLQGVDFFWTTVHMLPEMLFLVVFLLPIYFIWDSILYKKEDQSKRVPSKEKLAIEGGINIVLLLGVIGAVLFSGFVKLGGIDVYGVFVPYENLMRDLTLLLLSYVSWKITDIKSRMANGFDWFPIQEVGKLFAGIFITIVPAIAILKAGTSGSLGFIVDLVTLPSGEENNLAYFWITGVLSAFLDNAPTYLVFFNTAGGAANVAELMREVSTLAAISCGAVFMGAMSYIGNAPNFMVKSIAETSGIQMPSFFGYMVWSIAILVPLFVIMSFIFFS
jgi:Na+/H+ antiporter NhaD/arsenite permease-like protein